MCLQPREAFHRPVRVCRRAEKEEEGTTDQSLRQSTETVPVQSCRLLEDLTWMAPVADGVMAKSCRTLGPVNHSRQMARQEEACSVASSVVEAAEAILEATLTCDWQSMYFFHTSDTGPTKHALQFNGPTWTCR